MDSDTKFPRKKFRGTRNGIRYSQFARAFAEFQALDFEEVKKTEIAPDQAVRELFDEPVMWVELAEHFEDTFGLALIDTDLWKRLADQHARNFNPIRDSLTFYRLWLFLSEMPKKDDQTEEIRSTSPYGELLAKCDLASLTRCLITESLSTFPDDDWELLPDGYTVNIGDEQQMSLFCDLDSVAYELDFDISMDDFFGLFEENPPIVSAIVEFVKQAYTAEIA